MTRRLNRTDLLGLGWSSQAAKSLQIALDNQDVTHIVVTREAGRLAARAYPSRPSVIPADAIGVWYRSGTTGRRRESRTQQALRLVHEGANPNQAAAQLEISPSGIYKALKAGTRCPCCGTILRNPSPSTTGA